MSKKKKVILIPSIIGVVIVFVGIMIGIINHNKFTLRTNEVTLELGEELSQDVSTYIKTGSSKIRKETELDFSDVQIKKVGEYKATATYKKKVLEFTIIIEDTTAPTAEFNNKIFAGVNLPLYTENIISSITEASDKVIVSFQDNDYKEDSTSSNAHKSTITTSNSIEFNNIAVIYDKEGEYDNKITLEDESGNKSEYEVHITVVNAPVISNATDMVVQKGSEVDYLYGVSAKDGGGNDLEITVDSSSVDVNTVGEYKVVYSVVDSNGIEAKEEVKVTVVDDIDVSLSGNTDTVRAVSNGETLGGTEMREKIDITKAQESADKGTTSSQSKPSNQNSGSQGSNSSTNSSGSQSSEESYVDTRPSAPDIQAQSVGEGSVGTCTPAQKAYIDGLVGTWKNGGMSNSQLIDSILAYFDEQGVQSSGSGCMLNNKFLVTSVEQAKSIQKFNLNASFIYSYASTYLDGTADETGRYLNCSETYVNIW